MPEVERRSAIKEVALWVGLALALLKGLEGAVSAINAIDQSFRAMLARRSTTRAIGSQS